MSGAPRRLSGGCHCGALSMRLEWPADESVLPARRCGCSFCTRSGAVWTSHPAARLTLTARDESSVQRYRFGTETAEFLICAHCGVLPVAIDSGAGQVLAVVNVNTLVERGGLTPAEVETDFEGESPADRRARRQRRWIGQVSLQIPA